MSLDEIPDHSVTEFSYAKDGDEEKHWSKSSLYLNSCVEENSIEAIAPYLSAVFPRFNWYGPNRIDLTKWAEVKSLALGDPKGEAGLEELFDAVDRWLKFGNGGAAYFWILGP